MAATGTGDLMASSYRSSKMATKSTEELKNAREMRATEAFRMKDEQLKILSEQNASLLASLDKVEEDANTIQLEKLAIEQENRSLRDNNFDLQSRTRAAETQTKKFVVDLEDKEKQLRIMTDQNAELLRLLESEEALATHHQNEIGELKATLNEVTHKYGGLLVTAKTHEEIAIKSAKEGQLRAEEIRILRTETEQLKQQNSEFKMKAQVELENLQEQLRVRKEKQYQLLEKLQAQEEAKRQAEDQVAGMEDQLRALHAKKVEFEALLQAEATAKQALRDANKELQVETASLCSVRAELQTKVDKSEKERLRMEAEARDSSEQLREMAEKVFQLLERLKLAELGKTKSMEALKKKEQDMVALQKKNARLVKECSEEGRAKVKAEMDVKVLQEQVRTLKKHGQTVAQQSKEETSDKIKAREECEQLQEKLRIMESRLSFLLNKVQMDEEARVVEVEDRKKLETQVLGLSSKSEELQGKLIETGDSNRTLTQALRLKHEELHVLKQRYESMRRDLEETEESDPAADARTGARPGAPDSIENVRNNEGRGRFYLESKTLSGGTILSLKGRKTGYKDWLDARGLNDFLKRAQNTAKFRELAVEKMGALCGLLMVEEEERSRVFEELRQLQESADHQKQLTAHAHALLSAEEDAKRRMLLRYIHVIKEFSVLSLAQGGDGGHLQLPESNISDEEVIALSALLKDNTTIRELNLRGNSIGDDGARSLAAVLAGSSGLRLVDLRGNRIGKGAQKILCEALERSARVQHVYARASGKIEAIGVSLQDPHGSEQTGTTANVETVCVVDLRNNDPSRHMESSDDFDLKPLRVTESSAPFDPRMLIDSSPKKRKGDAKLVLSKSTDSLKPSMVFVTNPQIEKAPAKKDAKDTSEEKPVSEADAKKYKMRVCLMAVYLVLSLLMCCSCARSVF